VLLLALTGLDRAAVKACTALASGLLLALAFAISSLAAILGAGSAATPAAAPVPPAAVAPAAGALSAAPVSTVGGNAAVIRALANLGSLRWQDPRGDSLCEQFVENMYGATGQYPSAIAAWAAQAPADPAQLAQRRNLAVAPVGAKLYFFDPSQPDGHAGIYAGSGAFIAANDRAVELWDVSVWLKATGQSFLGWVAP